jgi:hypothetical protein
MQTDILNNFTNSSEFSTDYILTFNTVLKYYEDIDKDIINYILSKKIDKKLLFSVLEDIFEFSLRHRTLKDNIPVKIGNFDDMKIVYFLGIHLCDISGDKKYLNNMVRILDQLVYAEQEEFINNRIGTKIYNSIERNNWKEIFGIDGIYMIFKSAHRGLSNDE